VLQYPAAILATLPSVVGLDEIGKLEISIYDPSFTIGALALVVVGGGDSPPIC
jgi:hypothetical protein